jgi:hypothetical protein
MCGLTSLIGNVIPPGPAAEPGVEGCKVASGRYDAEMADGGRQQEVLWQVSAQQGNVR